MTFQKKLNDYDLKYNNLIVENEKMKVEMNKLTEQLNSNKIRLVVKDKKVVIPDEEEEDIKKVVSDAISQINLKSNDIKE